MGEAGASQARRNGIRRGKDSSTGLKDERDVHRLLIKVVLYERVCLRKGKNVRFENR
jgi:hypothetical protein